MAKQKKVSKPQFWVINIPDWGMHFMKGTKEEAHTWMVDKAQWEDCEMADMIEVPLWLYKYMTWHQNNETALNVAIIKSLSKEKAEEVIQMKVNLLDKYLKENKG